VWEQVGVQVPHILEEGSLGGHSYVLMEYIDAPVLLDAYSKEELATKGIFLEMGRTLRRMHTPEAQGYGRVMAGKAEFPQFTQWLLGRDVEERVNYVKKHDLLSEKHGSVEKAFQILQEYVGSKNASSYCHDDFGFENIFATLPMITVFDPNPRFNNRYIDLGRALTIYISQGIFSEQFLEGYFENDVWEEGVLRAAILLNVCIKFRYWHKVAQIQNMQEYLAKKA
jgi:fructosamine-3-kinase